MARILLILAIGVGTSLPAACSDPIPPADDFELPEPDLSLNPDRLSVGDYIATPCAFGIRGNRLDHLRSKHESALVDVFFGRASEDGPWIGPTASDVELVTSHGGRVLYHFNIPAVRARIILAQIPDLVEAGGVTVREVPDPTRYDVPSLSVGFTRPLRREPDVDLYVSLGGRVDHLWGFINALSGVLPDRSIPVLRDRSDVEYVEAHAGVSCLA